MRTLLDVLTAGLRPVGPLAGLVALDSLGRAGDGSRIEVGQVWTGPVPTHDPAAGAGLGGNSTCLVAVLSGRPAAVHAIVDSWATLRRFGAVDADLSGLRAPGAQLSGADLRRASLRHAVFDGADLTGCDLAGADLSGASLVGARLAQANLNGADLSRADLRRVDLSEADLRRVNVKGASLRGAELWAAFAGDVDFTTAHTAGCDVGRVDARSIS
ncbi:pentapeptide repeat-containing protein [Gandjariella thermophila]|uniref:Pentapeptide repeat-containing protein n=1 Tax=Gandjariella thermophila TaxID=1931992 RepID=A0A4D4JFS0_9PSEU|nr:pentapeptide repeat-containing protein [Gandjariella thermophila]GDY33850.1 hypothetical protein GTS_54830 [Gandjariella thermophila]